jgi:hypothetical protein
MSMKNLFLILLFALSLTSCVEVLYEEAQPAKTKSLTVFPNDLQGQYYISFQDSLNENDTLTISEKYFTEFIITTKERKKQPKKKMYLSDSLVLKQMDDNYILSFREKKTWMALILKPIKNYGYSVLWIDGGDENSVEKMQQITKAKIVKNDDGKIEKYIIKPKKGTFKKLLLKDGVFTELYKLKKLQD